MNLKPDLNEIRAFAVQNFDEAFTKVMCVSGSMSATREDLKNCFLMNYYKGVVETCDILLDRLEGQDG